MNQHVDLRWSEVEHPGRLDHLEPLVHHGRTVDRNFLSHLPVRMPNSLSGCDPVETVEVTITERATGCRQADTANPGHPTGIHKVILMTRPSLPALEDRTVFAVHRKNTCTGATRHGCYHLACGHERFLVSQSNSLATFDGRQYRRQPGKPHDAGDHDIDRPAGEFCTSCLATHDLDTASGKCLAQDRLTCLIGKADSVGTVPEGLLGKQSGIAAGNKNLDVELFGTAFHECQCAGADRPGGTEDCKLLCHA